MKISFNIKEKLQKGRNLSTRVIIVTLVVLGTEKYNLYYNRFSIITIKEAKTFMSLIANYVILEYNVVT